MKKLVISILTIVAVVATANAQKPEVQLTSSADSVSYMMGQYWGNRFNKELNYFREHMAGQFNDELFQSGFVAGRQGDYDDAITDYIIKWADTVLLQLKQQEEDERRAEWNAYTAQILHEKGGHRTKSGLLYRIDKPGNDIRVTDQSGFVVDYITRNVDGNEVFSKSHATINPWDDITAYWFEAIQFIGEGGIITIWVPSVYNLSEQKWMPLQFEIRLLQVVKGGSNY